MVEKTPVGLAVRWVTQDKEAARNMVFMYTRNSKLKGWWDHVRLIVWGPSANLLANDVELQAELEELKSAGVELLACKACADRYGVSDKLTELGMGVARTREPSATRRCEAGRSSRWSWTCTNPFSSPHLHSSSAYGLNARRTSHIVGGYENNRRREHPLGTLRIEI